MTHSQKITVGGENAYEILIETGALSRVEANQWPVSAQQFLLVSDSNVAPLYAQTLRDALGRAGLEAAMYVFPAGESAKNLSTFESVTQALAAMGARRDACILALGGGVVGDLAGFAAACWMRGIDFIQIPTSLLAMVDSSVGGKTGIDTAAGKNLLGAFHFPRAVLIDPSLLATLPVRERAAGFAEVIKYGALGDSVFFSWLESEVEALVNLSESETVHAIATCCQMKADIVENDPFERGERALLNFGHTFAHAIEAVQGFGGFNHGEAVAVGMCCAARLSEVVCASPAEDSLRLTRLLERFGLPTQLPADVAPEELLERMRLDKKANRNGMRFILWEGIGRSLVVDGVTDELILGALQR